MCYQNLQRLLELRAEHFAPSEVIAYPLGNTTTPKVMTYAEILHEARYNSEILRSRDGFEAGSVILLHLTDHLNGIIWFWSVLYAGCIPAMSTPLSNDPDRRSIHLEHLSKTLMNPLCITSENTIGQ